MNEGMEGRLDRGVDGREAYGSGRDGAVSLTWPDVRLTSRERK